MNVVFGIFVLYFLVPRRSAFLQLHSAGGLVTVGPQLANPAFLRFTSAPERGIPVEGKLSGGLELVRSCKSFFVVNC